MLLKIDQELKNLIPPLTYEERSGLEQNIIKNGVYDPIKVWDGIIVDGHNRYEICTKHGIDFKVTELDFPNLNSAKNWMIDFQLDRRSISDNIRKYLIGKRYQGEKKAIGAQEGNINANKNEVVNITTLKTAEKIAEQTKVSEKTVRNNESYAESIDKIAEASGKSAMEILSGTAKITQEDVKQISQLAPELQKKIVDTVIDEAKRSFKEVIKQEIPNQEIIIDSPDEIEEKFPSSCQLFIPTKAEIKLIPAGCDGGYCEINEKWYTKEQITQLKD